MQQFLPVFTTDNGLLFHMGMTQPTSRSTTKRYCTKPGVPSLGYMYPQGYISLSEGVHLRLAIASISVCYLFPNIYAYINEYFFKNCYMLIVKYIRE